MLTREDQMIIEKIIQYRLEKTLLSKEFMVKFSEKLFRVINHLPFHDYDIHLFKELDESNDSIFLVHFYPETKEIIAYRDRIVDDEHKVDLLPTFKQDIAKQIIEEKDKIGLEIEDNEYYPVWCLLIVKED